jgi:two-component system, chemotaxis family, sensor kinase CheA
MSDMENIVNEFVVESYENLDQLDRDLVALEKNPTDKQTLGSVFRAIHTIKGTCGFLGFSKLESVAHVGENLLSKLRDGKLMLNPSITTALLSMLDAVRQILSCIEKNNTDEGQVDYSALVARLTALTQGDAVPAPVEMVAAAAPPPALAVEPKAALPVEMPSAPPVELKAVVPAEPKVTLPVETPTDGEPEVDATSRIGDILIEGGKVAPEVVAQAAQQQKGGDPRKLGEILVEQQAVKPQEVNEALKTQGEARSLTDSNIRVDVSLLDKLMNLVGELVLARNQVLQHTVTQQDGSFIATSQRLNLITTELQAGVMKTRMQPIGNVWSKFPRVVRDLASGCGKQIRLEMEGKETELDKTIIEAIKDPLTHIVRNSADHGIEGQEARLAAGKPAEGCLRLRAFHEGGQVNIEISDDGAGIDPERVKAKALSKGLITSEQASRMTEREMTNLVFLPGFSTAEKITNVSGRGVGMDVVKTNIEKIGGTVDIQSLRGAGTTLKIKIPLTLAIIPALVVTSGKERYAIPQVSLLELLRLEGEQARKGIERINGAPVYRLRGNLLPLVYLNKELNLGGAAGNGKPSATASVSTTPSDDEAINIVVVQADGRPFGIVVEGINDTEEIVVKPLGKQLKGLTVFAGATIMGDGRVSLILDVMGIAQRASVVAEVRDRGLAGNARSAEGGEARQTLLLFALEKEGSRLAVPLSVVARLEEFPRKLVETAGGREVVQYRQQLLPLIRLGEVLSPGTKETVHDPMQVVVYSENGRSVGLVVDRILDIVEESLTIQRSSTTLGVLGSAVVQQRVTDLVDVPAIIRQADPGFYEKAVA